MLSDRLIVNSYKFLMASTQPIFLDIKTANGWKLYWLIAGPICLANLIRMATVDLSDAMGVSSMIQFSVRCSVPWLYLAFAASALNGLFPGSFTRWLLRNRRYVGLCFATGMAWQLVFILWLVIGYWRYYIEEAYLFSDLVVQVPGYLLLSAMTLTSFQPWRSKLSAGQWRILHFSGIYFLWATVWSTYWYELYYYNDIQFIDYIYYWAGLAAWSLRVLAWTKKRIRGRTSASP